MRKVTVLHYDAFSSVPNKGNPAGVVLHADELSADDMQRIALQVGFNETVFVLQSDHADLRLRYFTPGHEMNLCGHATVGSLYALKTRNVLGQRDRIQIETNVGVLPIEFAHMDDRLVVTMRQDRPSFASFNGDIARLAASMGLEEDELDPSMPIVYGSTGIWTLLVPIKRLSSFKNMKPNNKLFPDILTENPRASLHPLCMETYHPQALMHARHFSSPYSGTTEDPVTGTASGVMGAYYLTYVQPHLESVSCIVEQGQEIGRDGSVHVTAVRRVEGMDIFVGGTAVYVHEFEVEID